MDRTAPELAAAVLLSVLAGPARDGGAAPCTLRALADAAGVHVAGPGVRRLLRRARSHVGRARRHASRAARRERILPPCAEALPARLTGARAGLRSDGAGVRLPSRRARASEGGSP